MGDKSKDNVTREVTLEVGTRRILKVHFGIFSHVHGRFEHVIDNVFNIDGRLAHEFNGRRWKPRILIQARCSRRY